MRNDATTTPVPFPVTGDGKRRRKFGSERAILLAGVYAAMFCVFCAVASAAEPLDTSHLPHVADAKEIYASAPTSIYAVPETVAETAAATDKALAADGWRQYLPPNAEQMTSADQQIRTYKMGAARPSP